LRDHAQRVRLRARVRVRLKVTARVTARVRVTVRARARVRVRVRVSSPKALARDGTSSRCSASPALVHAAAAAALSGRVSS